MEVIKEIKQDKIEARFSVELGRCKAQAQFQKPWPKPPASAFHNVRPGQSRQQAVTLAWLGLAHGLKPGCAHHYPGSPAPGQAAPTIASPSLDSRNTMDFDPGDQGVPSPVLSDASMANNLLPQPVPIEQPYEFKTEFHPRSGREMLYQHFEEFGVTPEMQTLPAEEELWRPFQSHGDFEFSEIALNAALNKNQVDWLLSLMARISQSQAQITLKNEADLRKALDNAVAELTPFSKHEVKVPYKKEEWVYKVHACPLWDWALDLLNDPLLALHFVWDVQRGYKHDSTDFECFFNEPWTGDWWWDIQSHLPPDLNAAPFCFILYADKTRLSSHGTVKGYPVVARCANLPAEIRNGEGIGGGRVVRWLPIIPEDASEEGKLGYTTLKCVIWHESFIKLLVNLDQYSKTGYSYACYDNLLCWLFSVILILSGDYEEQCTMSLICGVQCKCPCPVCLVPLNELHDLSKTFPIRSAKDAQAALNIYKHNQTQGEEVLKGLGLRPVTNVLWLIENSDPHEALSLDDLHTMILADLGCEAEDKFEKQIAEFPQWCALTHFTTVIHITFSDGNKGRDLVKQAFYVALSVLKHQVSSEGYHLLWVIRSYLHLDSLIRLDVHTEWTLAMIDADFLVYDIALKAYFEYATTSSFIEDIKTDWNFPKTHLWKHAQRDIKLKGVACNFSTHPNDKLHGPLKLAYLSQSNGKDIAKQDLPIDHHKCAALLLRGCVDTLDEQHHLQALGDARLDVSSLAPLKVIHEYHYLKLNYESTVNWKQSTDHLRSNPSFHGSLRFNCALIQLTAARTVFVKIILMFKCEVTDGLGFSSCAAPLTRVCALNFRMKSGESPVKSEGLPEKRGKLRKDFPDECEKLPDERGKVPEELPETRRNGGSDEWMSGGAEERRSGGAEERRSGAPA
ncbi:uncharacterized protein HD556DRAFT_1451136 [Suillus plorans]|uniref:Uncharacterized protein n=1 Tax=Suillus plorans TaxID=116603 RepID=A0A9P7DAH2_9AGAM|nr:uncharacterized protein HD556DRAFT_1451136 [Suillus plorans]KAG1785043.1 hypothetical protein HD556DRAFT_1451136 [Suillus plorans]